MDVVASIMSNLAAEAQQADMVTIDATRLRAHRTAPGLRLKKGGAAG